MEKSSLTPERFPPMEYSGLWVEPIQIRHEVVSCLIFSRWHGKYYCYIPFFKRKTTSLLRPLSKAGDSGGGDLDRAYRL